MFKIGDTVKLSEAGVKYFCSDWEEYDVPHSMYCGDWGEVVEVEDGFHVKVWVKNKTGHVYYYPNQIELVVFAEKSKTEEHKVDAINSPKHYSVFDGVEAIEIIASSLTQAEFRGYCFGNLLKYRLRVGKKDNIEQELGKADKYQELFDKFKHLCKDEK